MTIARTIAQTVARPVATAVTGGSSGGGATSLDIRASVGTSTSPTATGTKAVTGVGFQPKVVLPFFNGHFATGAVTDCLFNLGAKTSGQASIGVESLNGLTTSSTGRRHDNSKALSGIYSGSVFASLDITSLDSDGFTGSWVNSTGARILNHICLGGADLEVSLVQCQMNSTNLAQSFAHGLSGAPTGVLFFGALSNTAPPFTETFIRLGIGAWTSSAQWMAYCASDNGLTTTRTARYLANSGVLGFQNLANGAITRRLVVGSVDGTNVNCTYNITAATYNPYFFMLAIRGAKCQVGTFDCNGSTSPLTIATTGITPKLFLPVFVPTGVDSLGSVLSDLVFAIGASDGTNNVSCGIQDVSGVTTTNARRHQSSTSLLETFNGNTIFQATAGFSGESVILTPTTNASSLYGQGAYLILGS